MLRTMADVKACAGIALLNSCFVRKYDGIGGDGIRLGDIRSVSASKLRSPKHGEQNPHPNNMRINRLSLVAQASLYVLSGINHFWHSGFYLHIMPDHYTHPAALVYASGAAEILGGIGLLVPATRRFSAAGIVLMLLVFLDVHQFMLTHHGLFPEVPLWLLWARIPFQFVLIAWAAVYMKTRRDAAAANGQPELR